MIRNIVTLNILAVVCASQAYAQESFESDVIATASGEIKITFLGHGTLMFDWGGKTIHVDPYSQVADYAKLPKADMVLITHEHRDHLDLAALEKIRTEKTVIVGTKNAAEKIQGIRIMNNGDKVTLDGIPVEAVPAYNIVHKRDNGQPFHPKGDGNGYILTFG
ncbi:MAG TPA: MBL fold metallo-hydrolase, partial [bacterium]|nr:MBL fold metallo-hydrolase [bacterium]